MGAEDKFEVVGFPSYCTIRVIPWLLGAGRPGLEDLQRPGLGWDGNGLSWAPRASRAGTTRDPGSAHGHKVGGLGCRIRGMYSCWCMVAQGTGPRWCDVIKNLGKDMMLS